MPATALTLAVPARRVAGAVGGLGAPRTSLRAIHAPAGRVHRRLLPLAAAPSDRPGPVRSEMYFHQKPADRRDIDVSASAASSTAESSAQTEPVTWEAPEDLEISAEATQEMGVEDLYEPVSRNLLPAHRQFQLVG